MNFLKAIGGKIWSGVKVVGRGVDKATDLIEPFQGFINMIPGPFGAIFGYMVHVEQITKDLTGKGTDKKAAVKALVKLSYPKINDAALEKAIDGIATILNDLAKEAPEEPVAPPE